MKKFLLFGFIAVLSLPLTLHAQISNLMVNGTDQYFTMTSGDFLSWSFNIPVGGMADIEVYIDVDGDSSLNTSVDRQLVFLRQIDGGLSDEGGLIPDFDFVENGSIHFGMFVGLAPSRYILRVSNGGLGQSLAGAVIPLASPSFSVSGTVTGPPGADLSYLIIDVSREDSFALNFWNGLTDGSGHYTVEMNDDTAGNPWWVSVDRAPRPFLVTSSETTLTITGDHTGVDFELISAAAQVSGRVLLENGDSLVNSFLFLEREDPGWTQVLHATFSDQFGEYWCGVYPFELTGNPWRIGQPYTSEPTTTHMLGMRLLSPFLNGDSLVRDITVYETNSTIKGQVTINGLPPGFEIMMFAENEDTARAWAVSNAFTGLFSIPVSDRISQYQILPYNLTGPYFVPPVQAAAGDSGVNVNVLIVDVEENSDDIPRLYSLSQNYPNPFNPVTRIDYALPKRSHVTITVFDLLGRKVAVLLDEVQDAGKRSVTFNGSNLPSGIYSYRITAGEFSDVKRMLLIK